MKFLNKSIVAAVLGLGLVTSSQAVDVYVTGSTAMRTVFYNACTTPGLVFSAAPAFAGVGGSGSGDTYMAFTGTLVGRSDTTTILTHWSGSEAGISDLTGGVAETFMTDAQVTIGGDPASGDTSNSQVVNLALADTDQASSFTTTPALTGLELGVITFKVVRNQGLWTGGNVSDSQLRQALLGGAPIGVFTGADDVSSYVYVAGRDTSSGTRDRKSVV